MENVKTSVKGSILMIEVDLKAKGHDSASGKTLVISTTSGFFAPAGTDVKVSLNVIRSKKQ